MKYAFEIYNEAYKTLVLNIKEMMNNGWDGTFENFKAATYDNVTGNIYLLDIKKVYLNERGYLKLVIDFYDTKGNFILHSEDRGILYDNLILNVVDAIEKILNKNVEY